MQRYCLLVLLMLLSPSAYADSILVSVGGHRLHRGFPALPFTSCASVSVSGIYRSRAAMPTKIVMRMTASLARR